MLFGVRVGSGRATVWTPATRAGSAETTVATLVSCRWAEPRTKGSSHGGITRRTIWPRFASACARGTMRADTVAFGCKPNGASRAIRMAYYNLLLIAYFLADHRPS